MALIPFMDDLFALREMSPLSCTYISNVPCIQSVSLCSLHLPVFSAFPCMDSIPCVDPHYPHIPTFSVFPTWVTFCTKDTLPTNMYLHYLHFPVFPAWVVNPCMGPHHHHIPSFCVFTVDVQISAWVKILH